jgi:sugar lactone lactonase YvrE
MNPDGLCLDAEGGLWVGSCFTGEFFRVMEGGRITHRIPTPGRWALATLLGGDDRRTLYLMSTETDFERIKSNDMAGVIEAVEVEVPGAGLP